MPEPFAVPREFIKYMNNLNRYLHSLASFLLIFGFPLILITIIATQTNVYSQPEDILIDSGLEGLKKSRPAVTFPHTLHMDSHDCLECHHNYQNGENVLDEEDLNEDGGAACSSCHFKTAYIGLKTAYHRQCIQCHRTLNRLPGNDLSITCRDCHPKD